MADRVMMLEIHYASGKTFYGVGAAAQAEFDNLRLEAERAPEPEGTRRPYMHVADLPDDVLDTDYDAWYAKSWIQDGVRVGPIWPSESPSSASEQERGK